MRFSPIAIAIALSLSLLGCMKWPSVAPGAPYTLVEGVSFAGPNEPGWRLYGAQRYLVSLTKVDAALKTSAGLTVRGFGIDRNLSDDEFRTMATRAKTTIDAHAKYYMDDHYDYLPPDMRIAPVTLKGAVCVSFDGAALYKEGKGVGAGGEPWPSPRYIKTIGYTCRHPMIEGWAAYIAYSENSTAPALTPEGRAIAEAVFDTVAFN